MKRQSKHHHPREPGGEHRPEGPVPRVVNTGEELGEGNRTAARRYNEGLKRTMETKDTEALAEDARRALEGPEGPLLRDAERRAKKGPAPKPGPTRRGPQRP